LTKAAPTTRLGFRAAYAQHDECLEPESLRLFGWMLARAEDIGEIVRELDFAGVRHTEAMKRSCGAACWRS
jgi:hypothetical protein